MTGFFRDLDDQVVLGEFVIPRTGFLVSEPNYVGLPKVDGLGQAVGRLYRPGVRHCLLFRDPSGELVERGFPWLSWMPWIMGDVYLAQRLLHARSALSRGEEVFDITTGQPVFDLP